MLGNAAGPAPERQRCEVSVAQEENPIHEVPDAGELVRRDDGRDATFRRLVHGTSDGYDSSRRRGVVDEHDLARTRRRVPNVRRAGHSQQTRVPEVLDRARIGAPEAGKALEQSGGAGTPSAASAPLRKRKERST